MGSSSFLLQPSEELRLWVCRERAWRLGERHFFLSPPPTVIDIKLDKPQEPPASEGGCSC